MDKMQSRNICFAENRCHFCKKVVGNPPTHLAATCPALLRKTKSDYPAVSPEVPRPLISVKTLLTVPATLLNLESSLEIDVLLDSGAMGTGYIDESFAKYHGIILKNIDQVIKLQTVDGRPCGSGEVTHVALVNLRIQTHEETLKNPYS